MSKLEPRSKMW